MQQKTCAAANVVTCNSIHCSWNAHGECFALTIKVGGGCPACDTFTLDLVDKFVDQDSTVSECDIGHCGLNSSRTCSAESITLGNHAGHVDCLSYRPTELCRRPSNDLTI